MSKKFPLIGNHSSPVGYIPWWVAEQAYIVYASKYGTDQTLDRLAERGGFGIEEMDEFFPEWRDKCSLIKQLQSQLAAEQKTSKRLRELLEKAWNVVSDLDECCASDVATGCWPAKLGYSEKDVRRINKEIETFMEAGHE